MDAEITGPSTSLVLKLLLDTGATMSLIKLGALQTLGLDPGQSPLRVTMSTGNSVAVVPVVVLTRFSALGQNRFGFSVIADALVTAPTVDGPRGLDLLRGQALTIDFRAGQLTLT